MLGRAAKAYVPAPNKNDLSKQLFPSSSPVQDGNIADGFKKARPASQSISGYVGGPTLASCSKANSSNALRARSPNITQNPKKRSSPMLPTPPTSAASSIFNRANSFQETQDTVDLTQDDRSDLKLSKLSQHVDVYANDFDSDIDLSENEDMAPTKASDRKLMPEPQKLSSQKSPNPGSQSPAFQNPSNIAMTWSSSPPSHMEPPHTSLSRIGGQVVELEPNPRPAKRRTLPWAQKRAEADEIADIEEDRANLLAARATSDSSPVASCFRCKQKGHFANECPIRAKGKGTEHDFTPLPKDKKLPWNNTGSAIGMEKKLFREKQKIKSEREKERKQSQANAMAQHQRKTAAMAAVTLSEEQNRVLELVCNQSKSVFFTGSAGTGKSVLMRAIIERLKKAHVREPERVAVTASTGLAACNIGGVTLHSFGGIGLGKEDVPTLVKKIKRNQKAKNRWLKTKILVIDEISMVDGDLFDKLEGIARALRNNGRPFGGIQLVITGDFFQLPPVPDYDSKARGAKFAFDANTWATSIHHTIGLTQVFRQKDPVFANMLNEMRLGKITDDTVKAFKKLDRPIQFEDGLMATELFPTRNEVDNSNAFRMRDLQGKLYRYEAVDSGTITDMNMRDKLLSNMMAPKAMELKKGAQVMLIKNMDDGLVNGSLGKVVSFMTEATFEIYDKHPEILDETVDDDDLDTTAREFRNSIKRTFSRSSKDPLPDTGKLYPLVQFTVADQTLREILVQPEEWKVELPNGEVQAQRSQLPLILAWALSIHKAQGQTLEKVKIDLKKIFEKGQAYVALSRATSQAGLTVLNFDKSKVMAHPRVAQFYNSLYSVNKALANPTIAKAESKKILATIKAPSRAYDLDGEDEEAAMRAYG